MSYALEFQAVFLSILIHFPNKGALCHLLVTAHAQKSCLMMSAQIILNAHITSTAKNETMVHKHKFNPTKFW